MSDNFSISSTSLDGVSVATRLKRSDARGSFERFFCINELAELLDDRTIVQINRSITHEKGSVRGMHLQKEPKGEFKIITCIRGSVFDVAVDLRQGSGTYLNWFGIELNSDNQKTIFIPEGFAHGFQVLSDGAEMIYFHTQFYELEFESGVHPLDPAIDINWPLPVKNLSEKDANRKMIKDHYG
jgi:dTDP-4-dehydrorhamnose 3,5-epimerase